MSACRVLLPAPSPGVNVCYRTIFGQERGRIATMALNKRMLIAAAAVAAWGLPAPAVRRHDRQLRTDRAEGLDPDRHPAKAGQLTVEVSLPAPIWWNGDTPETIKDGMEYCMAAEIAWRAGYDKLEVVNVGWDPLVTGQTSDFDLALSRDLDHRRAQEGGRLLGPLFLLRHRRAGAQPTSRSTRSRSRTRRSACSRRPPAPPSRPTSSKPDQRAGLSRAGRHVHRLARRPDRRRA